MPMTVRRRVVRHDTTSGAVQARPDSLAVEEPLELRVDGRALTVTMRTPGHDVDLALGFLAGEGVVHEAADVVHVQAMGAVVEVRLADHVPPVEESLRRHVVTSSACGVCGSTTLEQVAKVARVDLAGDGTTVPADVLAGLPDALLATQTTFARTGGTHAAGLFTATGEAVVVREDVGRHNAVDKVVGWLLRERGLPGAGLVLQVSGRASFELAQKARLAGIPVLSAVSAPSSMAVELAADAGLTLVGFNRAGRFTVYAGGDRIT